MSSNGKLIPFPAARLDKAYQAALNAAAKTPRIPSQQEYEARERSEAVRKEREVEGAPLPERKEAQAEFLEAMAHRPEIVAERIGWAIDGNYGFGVMQIAKEIVANKRMNREAALTHLVAIHEWQVPRAMAIAAWKKLTPTQQKQLDKLVRLEIRDAEKEDR